MSVFTERGYQPVVDLLHKIAEERDYDIRYETNGSRLTWKLVRKQSRSGDLVTIYTYTYIKTQAASFSGVHTCKWESSLDETITLFPQHALLAIRSHLYGHTSFIENKSIVVHGEAGVLSYPLRETAAGTWMFDLNNCGLPEITRDSVEQFFSTFAFSCHWFTLMKDEQAEAYAVLGRDVKNVCTVVLFGTPTPIQAFF